MSEKSSIDIAFRDIPYEQDHTSFSKEKGDVLFSLRSEDFSEDKFLGIVSRKYGMSLEATKRSFSRLPKSERESLVFEFRKAVLEGFLFDFYKRGYSQSAGKKHEADLRKQVSFFMNSIESEYFGDYSDITELKIQNGILGIARGKNIRQIDLVHALIKDHDPRRRDLQKRTHESAESLKDKISTEVYMAGVVSVEYEQIDTGKRRAVTDVVAAGAIAHSVGVPLYRIRKMMVRNKEGKMEEIVPSERTTGTKVELEKQLLGSIRSSGYIFDTARQIFKNTTREAIEYSIHTVALSTFDQYRKISGIPDTPENRMKFEQARTAMLTEAHKALDTKSVPETEKALESLNKKLGKIPGFVLSMGMETIFWGVFFSAYHKNAQDFAGLGAGVAEVALFRTGSYAGRFIPAPPMLKWATPMIGGMALVAAGHLGASFGGMDKAFWREFPDREDYSEKNGGGEGNSLIGHILTAGPVNALYDALQTDLRIGKREGTDMKIPFANGKITTIGSLDVGRSTVDMNTPPWEYMGEWMARDREVWNAQVEKYREWLTVQVLNLFRQYDEGKNVFESSNVLARAKGRNYDDVKKEILGDRIIRLFPHFDPEGQNHNKQPINDIIRQSLEYVGIKPETRRNQLISFYITQQVDMSMNLSNRNINMYKFQTEKEASFMGEITNRFVSEFGDSQTQEYMRQIFGSQENGAVISSRIFQKKRLVNLSSNDKIPKGAKIIESTLNGVWIEKEVLGTKGKQWIEGWEHKTFRAIIDSNAPIKDPILKEMFGGGKDIAVGEVFYMLLNQTVELKRMKEFTTNIAQTDRAQKWKSGLDIIGIK